MVIYKIGCAHTILLHVRIRGSILSRITRPPDLDIRSYLGVDDVMDFEYGKCYVYNLLNLSFQIMRILTFESSLT